MEKVYWETCLSSTVVVGNIIRTFLNADANG